MGNCKPKEAILLELGNSSEKLFLIRKAIPMYIHLTTVKIKQHFVNVGKFTYEKTQQTLHNDNYVSLLDTDVALSNTNHFRPQPVDVSTVILTVKALNDTKSVGSDGIPLKFIRDALHVVAQYLTCIINTSIVTGVFPDAWKHAVVVPIFKNGDADNVSNYRPISLLPILSKILEKIIANQLTNYLEDKKLLSNSQHGFRRHLSTETALTVITDKIYKNMDQKKISLLTLCDLSKAFDSVNHNILIQKCVQLKIDPLWFSSYLKNRTQSVRVKNSTSKKKYIHFGVPQGSVLGPILFNIFVNDLIVKVKNCLVVQYADDTQFLHSSYTNELPRLIRDTEATLKCVKNYFLTNGLMLNAGKTQCILIGNRQLLAQVPPNIVIQIDGDTLTPSNCVKNLSVYMDRFMLFDKHTEEMSKKVVGLLMFLSRISKSLDKPSRILVVQTIILSLINYCIRMWGTTNLTIINKTQKLQNFAAKLAMGNARKFDHASPIIQKLGWLKIIEKYKLETCATVFKILNGFHPDWYKKFLTVHEATDSSTRQQSCLFIPKTRTDTGARSLDVTGPKMWNNLPSDVTSAVSVSSFKSRLTRYLLR